MTTDAPDQQPLTAAAEPGASVVRLHGIQKRFGKTQALRKADLECQSGEVHSVLGENGSGKSTLVKTLSGVLPPDGGTVELHGEEVSEFTPQEARERGVATVFQEVLVAPNESVASNIFLGQSSWFRWRRPRSQRRDEAIEWMRSLTGTDIDPTIRVEQLSLMRQHQVAIARALALEPRILILDESTAALDLDGRDRLFEHMRDLADRGGVVIFISHRLDEVTEVSDKVTVLRSGENAGTVHRGGYTTKHLLALMSGESVAASLDDGRP